MSHDVDIIALLQSIVTQPTHRHTQLCRQTHQNIAISSRGTICDDSKKKSLNIRTDNETTQTICWTCARNVITSLCRLSKAFHCGRSVLERQLSVTVTTHVQTTAAAVHYAICIDETIIIKIIFNQRTKRRIFSAHSTNYADEKHCYCDSVKSLNCNYVRLSLICATLFLKKRLPLSSVAI